jgi:hypothetical protein
MSNPPRRVDIRGQDHMLSYITPEEADILMFLGGSGEAGPMGIPAFRADPGQMAEAQESLGQTDYGGGMDFGGGMGEGQDSVTPDTYSPSGGSTGGGDSGSDEQYRSIPDPEFSPPVVAPPPAPVNTVSDFNFGGGGDSDYDSYMAGIAPVEQVSPVSQVSPQVNAVNQQVQNLQNISDIVASRKDPIFDEKGQVIGLKGFELPGQKKDNVVAPEQDFRGLSRSEFEKLVGITDTNPYGTSKLGGSSTMFGRGIAQFANQLGLKVDPRGNLTKGQLDFVRDQAYQRYVDPYGEAKMFSTMRNFNLSPAEKAEYERQQQIQQTRTPSRVQTYADKARQLGEDPSRYEQPNTIRSGMKEGQITNIGRIAGRPREMSDAEMVARLGIAGTPMGLPLAAAENIFGLNRELGIEGQLGPDGKPFVAAEGQGGLGQLFSTVTGGAGTRALDRASQLATGLINKQPDIPGLTSGANAQVDVGIYDRPNLLERLFGGESSYNERYAPTQYPVGGGDGGGGESNVGDVVINDPEEPVQDGTTSDGLFGQEMYQGPKGGFIFDPVRNLPEVYARNYFPVRRPIAYGLGGIPTRNV